MDREREQFFPERGIVKKKIIVMLIIVVCVPNYRNGIDQENFYLHKKAETAGKGIGYSRGMGRVSFQNSYQV